jgi:hypothetical protein
MDMQACVNHISFLQVVGVPRSPSPGYEILFHPSWTLKQKRPSGVVVLMLNWADGHLIWKPGGAWPPCWEGHDGCCTTLRQAAV